MTLDNSFNGFFVHLFSHDKLQCWNGNNDSEKYSGDGNLWVFNVLMVVVFELHAVLRLGGVVKVQFVYEPTFLINQNFVCFIECPEIKMKSTERLRWRLALCFCQGGTFWREAWSFSWFRHLRLTWINAVLTFKDWEFRSRWNCHNICQDLSFRIWLLTRKICSLHK